MLFELELFVFEPATVGLLRSLIKLGSTFFSLGLLGSAIDFSKSARALPLLFPNKFDGGGGGGAGPPPIIGGGGGGGGPPLLNEGIGGGGGGGGGPGILLYNFIILIYINIYLLLNILNPIYQSIFSCYFLFV